jgi:predicted membrane chloride channel (bestrophin family)
MTLPVILITLFDGVASLLATFMISFGLIGIEEAGKIIENPFGLDDSDLVRQALHRSALQPLSLHLSLVCTQFFL